MKDITLYIFLAGGSLSAIILMSVAGGIFLHGKPKPETYKKISVIVKSTAFAFFLVMGFSLVPIMVKFFTDALVEVIPQSNLPLILQANAISIVYLFWLVYIAGTVIAFPAMKKSGFFAPELPPEAAAPKGALPPLEYQIKFSKIIVLARTEIVKKEQVYRIEEIWKQTAKDSSFTQGSSLVLDTKMWEMLGYQPKANQQVVCFFTEENLQTKSPIEILPVIDGEITYGPTDPTVSRKLKLAELKDLALKE